MKKRDFLEMPAKEQEAIVLAEFPNFQEKAYENSCFGIFYEVSDYEIQERVKYADDYDTYDTLQSILPDFNEKRANAVENGSPLTETERLALKRYVADEKGGEDWISVHGWNKTCDDGDVFLVSWGHSEGQLGIRLEYFRAFEDKRQAYGWLETFEIYSYM